MPEKLFLQFLASTVFLKSNIASFKETDFVSLVSLMFFFSDLFIETDMICWTLCPLGNKWWFSSKTCIRERM